MLACSWADAPPSNIDSIDLTISFIDDARSKLRTSSCFGPEGASSLSRACSLLVELPSDETHPDEGACTEYVRPERDRRLVGAELAFALLDGASIRPSPGRPGPSWLV